MLSRSVFRNMVFGGLCLWNSYREKLEEPVNFLKVSFQQCVSFSSISEYCLAANRIRRKTRFRPRDSMVSPWCCEIAGSCRDAVRYHGLFRDQRNIFLIFYAFYDSAVGCQITDQFIQTKETKINTKLILCLSNNEDTPGLNCRPVCIILAFSVFYAIPFVTQLSGATAKRAPVY